MVVVGAVLLRLLWLLVVIKALRWSSDIALRWVARRAWGFACRHCYRLAYTSSREGMLVDVLQGGLTGSGRGWAGSLAY